MKVCIAQLNPTIGDFSNNTKKIITSIKKAISEKCDLILFSELAISGYPVRDRLFYESFCEDNLKCLDQIAKESKNITVVCGYIEKNPDSKGKPYFNSAAILQNGKQIGNYRKRHLPYYDIFDEQRFFEEGDESFAFKIKDYRFGVTICEDIWSGSGFLKRDYKTDIFKKYPAVDALINISASPFSYQKPERRLKLFEQLHKKLKCDVLYCDQVGAQDEIIFDGGSGAYFKNHKAIAAKLFHEDLLIVDLEKNKAVAIEIPPKLELIEKALILGIQDYLLKTHGKKVILGLSGGIDSTLCAALAVKALKPANVIGVSMPSKYTSKESIQDARKLAKNLGIEFQEISIEPLIAEYQAVFKNILKLEGVVLENIQPRIRMTLLMAFANKQNAYLLNTSNKSEIATGYSTLYGDTAGALSVIGDLTKNEVFELTQRLMKDFDIPKNILEKEPSAELKFNQKDSDTLPRYAELDAMVSQLIEMQSNKNLSLQFKKLYAISEYKRKQFPPILRVTEGAFGIGRRMPVVGKYQ